MFIKKLEAKMGKNKPILLEEIFDLFKDYSRVYVFKQLKKCEELGQIIKTQRGVYYIPTNTILGLSSLSSSDVVAKKYISNDNACFGVYGGIALLNYFGVTTQVPNTVIVITNKESTRGRKISINRIPFVIKKSRIEISKKNQAAYTIVQLFYELGKDELLNGRSLENVKKYVKDNSITKEELIDVAMNFPNIVMKKMRANGVFNYIA